jgi:tRNA A-37 threonylcarbamoyl transferase component Bud32
MVFTKRFSRAPRNAVKKEVALQRIGSEYGMSPCVLDTDNKTYISMEDLGVMSIADQYGENIEDIPENIRADIWNILWILFSRADIEYVDVTPYNFIEKDGRLWVVDYGHAKKTKRGKVNPWLLKVLSNPEMTIYEWNPEFA